MCVQKWKDFISNSSIFIDLTILPFTAFKTYDNKRGMNQVWKYLNSENKIAVFGTNIGVFVLDESSQILKMTNLVDPLPRRFLAFRDNIRH